MGRAVGRQLNKLFTASYNNADILVSWLAVEIDAQDHDLYIYGIDSFLRFLDAANLNSFMEYRVDVVKNVSLNREDAVSDLGGQIAANAGSERLWGMEILRENFGPVGFCHPIELPAGAVYTIAMESGIHTAAIVGQVDMRLTVRGKLIPAIAEMRL